MKESSKRHGSTNKTLEQSLNPNAATFVSHSTPLYGRCSTVHLEPYIQHYPTLSLLDTFTQSSEDAVSCSEDSALQSDEDSLIVRVRKQLEYYFSLDNLTTDQYLVSQMDGDQFVPIWTVANFNAVKCLTSDIDVIKQALHSSKEVQIDSTGSKVRPILRRCTLILRDIAKQATPEEVAGLFNNSADCPPCVKCTFAHNNSWFVEFTTEHEALQAYEYFREHPHYFHGDLIKVRIKAKPIQRSSPTDPTPYNRQPYQASNIQCYPIVPLMWMSSSGIVPLDGGPQCSYASSMEYPVYDAHKYRHVRNAETAGYNRRKHRRNNWRGHDEYRYLSDRRYNRNDSDDSSTSASSYNVPPLRQDDESKGGRHNKSYRRKVGGWRRNYSPKYARSSRLSKKAIEPDPVADSLTPDNLQSKLDALDLEDTLYKGGGDTPAQPETSDTVHKKTLPSHDSDSEGEEFFSTREEP